MNKEPGNTDNRPATGIIAVIQRDEHFLVIKRSQFVRAPGQYCFPGGGQENDETDHQTIVRELREELTLEVNPVRLIWESVSPWKVKLRWWLTEIANDDRAVANPDEVQWWGWMSLQQLESADPLLPSNREFIEAIKDGSIEL